MSSSPDAPPRDALRALLHRWFVQYNPTYLLSAAMVFVGCFLWSRSVVGEGIASTLGIPIAAEAYALALIGGAALLVRIGQRRPAVILALVTIVYQWDTTLHTEAAPWMGSVGAVACVAWVVLFAGKLFALGWALRVRFSAHVVGGALAAALLLAATPWLALGRAPSVLVAVAGFAFGSLDVGTGITSEVELDAWGTIVLRRVTRAAWLMSGALVALHVLLWSANGWVTLAPLVLVLPLVGVRRVRSEALAFSLALGPLVLAVAFAPAAFGLVALLSAAALGLRLFAPRFPEGRRTIVTAATTDDAPYREGTSAPAQATLRVEAIPAIPLAAAERLRATATAIGSAYLGIWTTRWSGGAWPTHVLPLDGALALVTVGALLATRGRVVLAAPGVLAWAHLAFGRGWIPTPKTSGDWGKTSVALGFALLLVSLGVSFRLRGARVTSTSPSSSRS